MDSTFDAIPTNSQDSVAQQNKQALIDVFRSGAKPDAQGLGIELEHIIVDGAGQPLPYSPSTGGTADEGETSACVRDILEALRPHFPIETRHGDDLLGVSRPGAAITIEPSAQLELSAGPFPSLADARDELVAFEKLLAETTQARNASVQTVGYDMARRATDKILIPKERYEFMNRYLSEISPYGPCMMRASASTQISIDYTDEADAVRKLRLASAVAPLLSLITDNAPVFEAAPRTHRMVRTKIWMECDPARCSTAPGVLDADFSFEKYADWILRTPAIVKIEANGTVHYDTAPFSQIFADFPMTESDAEHALSMVFPDARLKSFVEIRPADSMPVPYVLAYAALIKGLFYSAASLDEMDGIFGGVTKAQVDEAKESFMAHGYEGKAFGCDAAQLCDKLIESAFAGLPANERRFLEPLGRLVERRITLADQGGAIQPLTGM